ncbi:365_t:CDS:1 [Funneliformis geosporum]|uniref:365_t:CDS:1 n=1 Tax=Funneliformis geosporum TaxID=1117311 RepID=A0A9W4T5R7_9GLOM|nr:365_t:CDS:1 [Funneliformis geosporum]
MVEQLFDAEFSYTINLISTMHYSRGPNKGKIYSSYLQKKANEYLDQTLYKHQNYQSLQDSNSQLEKTNKKYYRKNQVLIRQTQSFGAQTQHLRDQKSKQIAEIHSLV